MSCCQIESIEEYMDADMARRELTHYREKGPDRTTAVLLEALSAHDLEGKRLLDIGGGVGALQHVLLEAGVRQAVSVDASSAYLAASKEEAERRGHAGRLVQHHGDFVQLADGLERADIVTLDRVICCYDDMQGLVSRSAPLAQRLYGVVYPRDEWWARAVIRMTNLYYRVRGWEFRIFAHPNSAIESAIRAAGLEPSFDFRTIFWRVGLYIRNGASPS